MLALIYLALAIALGDPLCGRFYRFVSVPHRCAAAILVGLRAQHVVHVPGGACLVPHSRASALGGHSVLHSRGCSDRLAF